MPGHFVELCEEPYTDNSIDLVLTRRGSPCGTPSLHNWLLVHPNGLLIFGFAAVLVHKIVRIDNRLPGSVIRYTQSRDDPLLIGYQQFGISYHKSVFLSLHWVK